jgi:D-serine deaminase-like pyridoxal phosphate-dependent protein
MRLAQYLPKSFPDVVRDGSFDVDSFRQALPLGLSAFATPLIVINEADLNHNLKTMREWCEGNDVEIMPHGKTTMSPQLWRRQIAEGATGITAATGWQALEMLKAGIKTVQVANESVDPVLLSQINLWLLGHADQQLVCWVDSSEAITILEHAISPELQERFGVLVELGAQGARGGVRTMQEALSLVDEVAESTVLTLKGVAGYEGSLGHDRSEAALNSVSEYMNKLVNFLEQARDKIAGTPWISAGGSAYFDIVTQKIREVRDARKILRSGAYIAHDDGFYKKISPFDEAEPVIGNGQSHLDSAIKAYARVISIPEPGLALLDAGKRDFSYDEGLPVPLAVLHGLGEEETALHGYAVKAMNDQHTHVSWDVGNPAALHVGDVVRLGLSHPCTAFDKWRVIPVVNAEGSTVTDVVETVF